MIQNKILRRPQNEVLKEGQTKAWDHLQTIELEKLCIPLVPKVSDVEGMISFDHFYTFHRTLKRWTTGTLWRHKGLVAGIQRNAKYKKLCGIIWHNCHREI